MTDRKSVRSGPRLIAPLACIWAALSVCCMAEESPVQKRISADYRNLPVAEVLKDLGGKTGLRIAYATDLVQNLDNVSYAAKDQEAGRALTRILRPRGLNVRQAGDGSVSVFKIDPFDEFKIKREEVFAFASKPSVTRDGDKVTMSFETKAFCDVTVAIEDANGKIVRHLASGVLGENAPEPFQWNTKAQTLVWDGKNDKGEYVDDKNSVAVRVSLGLKAAYERPLFWSPHKRVGSYAPALCATPEGMYVCEGYTADTVRLYDHDGNYVRTVYPFPAGKVDQVAGMEKQTVLQTGQSLPRKLGCQQATLLTSGNSALVKPALQFGGGIAATAMAVQGDRMALAFLNLNRLRTDGTTGGLPLKGPATGLVVPKTTFPYGADIDLGPSSAAFSPDGKTLYLTGYVIFSWYGYARQGVYKLAYEKDEAPEVFAGNMDPNGHGDDNAHFAVPNAVACDAKGRVYVADYLNNRVQIYDADGKHLKTLVTPMPAKVQIDPRTQEIYVYSWFIDVGICNDLYRKHKLDYEVLRKYKPILTRFGSFDDPRQLARWDLPVLVRPGGNQSRMGQVLHVEMDFWAKQPTLWMAGRRSEVTATQIGHSGVATFQGQQADDDANTGIVLLVRDGDQWKLRRNFADDARKAVARLKPPDFGIQRLSANEKTHKVFLLEHISFNKCNDVLIEIDPETGKCRTVPIPFGTEDMCFDRDGHAYLRTDREVVRYDSSTWREVPWDYGEERDNVGFAGGKNQIHSALPIPGRRPVMFHQSGMWVSPRGHLAVACNNPNGAPPSRADDWSGFVAVHENAVKYRPAIYPGRALQQPNTEIHVWNQHGKLVREDAVPGLGYCNGLGIDKDDNIYVLFDSWRQLGDKLYPNQGTCTLIKFRPPGPEPGSVRILSSEAQPLPLPREQLPTRPPDTSGGNFVHGKKWMAGAEWFYGGAGILGLGCTCYHTRFCMDTFARSFTPEPDLYSVAVLDSSGNLITRVGKYGSADDGIPLVPNSGIPTPHSIGGDEVPLFYPAYVGVDTDRRLFISDIGNARIVSVKLGYHAEEKVALKDVPERKETSR